MSWAASVCPGSARGVRAPGLTRSAPTRRPSLGSHSQTLLSSNTSDDDGGYLAYGYIENTVVEAQKFTVCNANHYFYDEFRPNLYMHRNILHVYDCRDGLTCRFDHVVYSPWYEGTAYPAGPVSYPSIPDPDSTEPLPDGNGGWTAPLPVHELTKPQLTVGADGNLQAFATGADGILKYLWMDKSTGRWSSPGTLNINTAGNPAAVVGSDGNTVVLSRGTNGDLRLNWMNSSSGNWSPSLTIATNLA
ncbi:hypothetical protein [Kitasatospora atroaurantiaca]|uniref:hypothetical protein n=1 Tax=Kitasatospora atroaurantiaca TaxID=285545 RepID=UPI001478AA3C|nr:hypothetical protein [Kitasatospora atroaurantiaca]